MKRSRLLNLLSALAVSAVNLPLTVPARQPAPGGQLLDESPKERAQRMKWLGEERFRLFIHRAEVKI